jgi:hypothetical protein
MKHGTQWIYTKKRKRISKVMIEAKVGQRVRPIPKPQYFTEGGAGSQRSDAPGGPWRSMDAGLHEAILDAAFEGSSIQRMMREGPAEENSTVLQMQAVALLQDESDSLHWADTQIILPRLDVEGQCKVTWMVRLGEPRRHEAKVVTFPTKMCVVAQEGHKLSCPLGGGRGHQKGPLPHQLGKGEINRPMFKNVLTRGWFPMLTPSTGAIIIEIVDLWMAMVLHDIPSLKRWDK